ncbi:tRNA-dihydrouridine synthase [Desulfosarcina alkanivorans]|uniref:tRNA-dihydrouridine synthase n=1 Tax=Desulfosarcina alkanivorans TaxID=571177 RepID=A0A5K7YD27_9BACT|nr:tRNA-dihydrouridine synthase family protein [Desulfosarcina alkanivorans]BBO66856.1 tRNA-dihydrouridine synthase [Desulfosarcina alkanivorans]
MKQLILAPLRGFTDAAFRNTFQHHFKGVAEAVAPFVTSIRGRRIKASHLLDLVPEDNRIMPVVPQILSNQPDEFICLANTLFRRGYREINWNLGCPYPMVAKKMRGSGLLPHPDEIDRMLEKTIGQIDARLSVKTRLGRFSADEMDQLIPVFNRYPLSRVIVHPRTGVQMYTGGVDLKAFETCLNHINHPVVYNGDINSLDFFQALEARFPDVSGWMLGRGLIANPFLAEMIQGGFRQGHREISRFARFHDDLLAEYGRRFSGPAHVLDRMKGFWRYFADGFADGRKILKRIRKAGSLVRYRQVVASVVNDQAPVA